MDGPVSYGFNTAAGTLERHAGYGIAATQSTSPGGTTSVMAGHVSACTFAYASGTPQRSGLVTLRLALTDAGETVTLLHQVHVENAP